MRKLITIILVLAASVAFGQTTYQLNYDSIRVGKTAGSGATSLYGKTYLKNATEGTPSDSVLTVRNGRVYKIAGSAISSVGFMTYVFSRNASDISGYEQMPALTSYTIGAADTATVAATTTPAIIQEFATNTGFPNTTLIPSGVFNVTYQTQKNSGSQSYYTYAVIYKRNLSGTETAIATTNNSSSVSSNTVQSVSVSAVSPTDISLLTTDRIVVKVFAVMVSGTADISIYYDDATDSRLAFPSALVDATNFVPYNGAVKDLVSAFSITGDSIKRVGGTGAQFLMGNGTVQDTTQIQTVSNFFPKGDTRYVTKATNQTTGLTGNKTWDGVHTFTTPITSSGADLRNLGGLNPIGLQVGSNYTIVGQPKTLMDFYGQSTINGAADFNSYNGSGGNKITPFSWKANGSTRLLDTLNLQSASTAYKATISIGTNTTPFSQRFDLGSMVFIDSAAIENPGESNPSFWFQNKTPLGYSGLGFRNTAGQYTADVGYSNLDSVLYFRSSANTKALVVALHPESGKNNGFVNFSNGRVNIGGFLGLTTNWRAAYHFVNNAYVVGDTINTTNNALQVHGNGKADMSALELRNSTFKSTITGQATANRTIKFQNKNYTVADSADVAAAAGAVSGTTNYLPIFTGTNSIGNSNWIQSGYMITPNNNTNQLVFSGNTTLIGSAIVLPGGSGTNADSPTLRMGNNGKSVATLSSQNSGAGTNIGFLAYSSDFSGTNNIKRYGTIGIDGKWYIGSDDGNTVTYGSHKFTIASAGNLGLVLRNGTSSDRFQFFVGDGTGGYTADENYIINNNTDLSIINNGGGVRLANGATSWAAISDENTKAMDEFKPFINSLDKVSELRAGTTRYKTDSIGVSRSFLIAQDVQKVLPEAVSIDKDGQLSLRYTEIIPLLVAAIKELKVRIEELEK